MWKSGFTLCLPRNFNDVFCLESISPDDMVVQRLKRSKTKYCLEYSQISRISHSLHHWFEYIGYIIEVWCMSLLSWKCCWRNRRRIRFSFCCMRKLYIGVTLTITSTNENIVCVLYISKKVFVRYSPGLLIEGVKVA